MEKAKEFHLKVTNADEGSRLDQYIIKHLPLSISRSRIQQLIDAGAVSVNQGSVKVHYRVKQGDSLAVNIPAPEKPQALAEEIPLEIIFEDEDLLVIDKPSGLVTHPAPGNYAHTLVSALLHYGCRLSSVNGPLRPGIVHRLDKDTSGLLAVAKGDFAHQHLARQFSRHSVKRKYIALVKGRVAHNEGLIDLPIARDPRHRQKMRVSFFKSRQAKTRYRVLKRYSDASLLELTAHTGRTHQLRVHLKFCGHPIIGDSRYGTAEPGFGRLALHATVLGFEHPRTKEFIEFRSDIPECFKSYIESLK